MQNEITNSITELNRQYETCFATEHTYRSALQQLPATLVAPDLILRRKEDRLPVVYVETKDIGEASLDSHVDFYLLACLLIWIFVRSWMLR